MNYTKKLLILTSLIGVINVSYAFEAPNSFWPKSLPGSLREQARSGKINAKSFPEMVYYRAVYIEVFDSSKKSKLKSSCNGYLLNGNHVLTTASCLYPKNNNTLGTAMALPNQIRVWGHKYPYAEKSDVLQIFSSTEYKYNPADYSKKSWSSSSSDLVILKTASILGGVNSNGLDYVQHYNKPLGNLNQELTSMQSATLGFLTFGFDGNPIIPMVEGTFMFGGELHGACGALNASNVKYDNLSVTPVVGYTQNLFSSDSFRLMLGVNNKTVSSFPGCQHFDDKVKAIDGNAGSPVWAVQGSKVALFGIVTEANRGGIWNSNPEDTPYLGVTTLDSNPAFADLLKKAGLDI